MLPAIVAERTVTWIEALCDAPPLVTTTLRVTVPAASATNSIAGCVEAEVIRPPVMVHWYVLPVVGAVG